jgi:MSHA biogenesis protein MshG
VPSFTYKARDQHGNLLAGVMSSHDSDSIAERLRADGVIPVEILLQSGKEATGLRATFQRRRVTTMDVQMFSRQMYTLMKSGVPILRGLAGLQESATNPFFAAVLQNLRESLETGRDLSTAMGQHPDVFTPFYLNLVQVGETTGRMTEIFLRLFEHLEFERDMRQRIKSAARYPLFVLSAMLVAMAVINLFVIPTFAKVYAGFHADLPLLTQLLVGISNFSTSYWPALLVLGVTVYVITSNYLSTSAGQLKRDTLLLKLPVLGEILLKASLSRFARSFSLANRSGVPLVHSLNIVSNTVDNAFVAQRLSGMRDNVERGDSIFRSAAAAGVFTPVVLQMIAVGEESGSLDELMDEVAQMYEREVDYDVKTLSSKIEPILIVGLGALVLILALGVFLPIWDLGSVAMQK